MALPVDEVIRRFLVTGKVQGVFFRQSTRFEANRLKLKGLVRNLPDGSVEVVARGSGAQVEALHQWLKRGPSQARVEEVRETDATGQTGTIPDGFAVF